MQENNQSQFISQGVNTSESTFPETARAKSYTPTKKKRKQQLTYIYFFCRCHKKKWTKY